MDSNVSKNTNSHKFFKIPLNREKLTISLRNLVQQWLLTTWDLYHQNFKIEVDVAAIKKIISSKIAVANHQLPSLHSINNTNLLYAQSEMIPTVYCCPIGLLLAAHGQLSLKIVMRNLERLLMQSQNEFATEPQLKLSVNMVDSGWLNIFLDSSILTAWLGELINQAKSQQRSLVDVSLDSCCQTPVKLFPVQYLHARCCSLLRLGAREKLVTLLGNFQQSGWQLRQPESISWLDDQQNLWLTELSEHNLLRQLLMVTDTFALQPDHNWETIAVNLSQTTAIFLADCRFLGEVKLQYPLKAIARLGLIALVQYWLQRILIEKLNLSAPTEL
ncbi:MAG: hypothetical protein AAGF83_18780 [Cyanobacteria bacterium P01_G01_bin.67]